MRILGAFGCGVFANLPEVVAEAFNDVFTEFRYHFEAIESGVYSTRTDGLDYIAFMKIRE